MATGVLGIWSTDVMEIGVMVKDVMVKGVM